MSRVIIAALVWVPICAAAIEPQNEWRLGVLEHNKGPIASETEHGPDLNLAYHHFLKRFSWLDAYAHAGAVLNLSDGTSWIYTGLNSQVPISDHGLFFELGGGFAVHDGDLEKKSPERRELGSRVLFHLESSLGYQFDNGMSLSFYFDHISNGTLLNNDDNRGLDTYGLRLGYGF